MNDFRTAAEKASFDVRKEYTPLLATHRVVLSESSAKKVTDIITTHYAEIEATFGLLCELAAITKNYFGCDDLYRIDGNPESRGCIRLTRDDYKRALFTKLNDHRIAALLAEKKG